MKALTASRPARATAREGTIYQVAQRAGVSIATVSRALHAGTAVAPRTRERVLRAVEELAYTPSHRARALAQGRNATDGIVFPDLSGPYFTEVLLGFEEVAAESHRGVLILGTHGREAAEEMILDFATRVDGLVVFGRTVGDRVLRELGAKGLPMVLVARAAIDGLDSVSTENESSARSLTAHLLEGHGYRSFAFLGDADTSPDTCERWLGFTAALAEVGVVGPAAPVPCAFGEIAGRAAADELLRTSPPRAVVCANDEIALGATVAAERLGLRIPQDVAVTGWDDVMAARHSRPGLTTVRQPMRELGARAARLLHERLAGDTSDSRHEVLPTQLVLRASCGHHPEEGLN